MRVIHSKSLPIPLVTETTCTNPIFLVTQFFVHRDKNRRREIQYCLEQNCKNPSIHTIYLLNERIYTEKELGVSDMSKIKQINIHTWIRFKHIFDFIETESLNGFVVAVNCDIMLDHTIAKLHKSSLSTTPSMIALLRYEYNDVYVPFDTNCNQSKLFGPRGDSQDTWIIHTNQNIPSERRGMFDFAFGKPGCDNKMVFLFHMLGYQVYNDPLAIRTFHFHRAQTRDYTPKDAVQPVYEYFCPHGITDAVYDHVPIYTKNYSRWNFGDNARFRENLSCLVETVDSFVIPVVDNLNVNGKPYEEVFQHSVYCFSRDVYGGDFRSYATSEQHIDNVFPYATKVWESLRLVPMFVFHKPWTLALAYKRLLIISPYAEKMDGSHPNKCFPEEVFRSNTFMYVPWDKDADPRENLIEIRKTIHNLKDNFDIALIDANTLTNVVACEVYKQGKSAISMGEDLSLLFGLYKQPQLTKIMDFWKGFQNEYWTKVD